MERSLWWFIRQSRLGSKYESNQRRLTTIVCCSELIRRNVFAGEYQMIGNFFWRLNSWIESVNDSNKSDLV